jgi:hypothetical protein
VLQISASLTLPNNTTTISMARRSGKHGRFSRYEHILALVNTYDEHHQRASKAALETQGPFVTTGRMVDGNEGVHTVQEVKGVS